MRWRWLILLLCLLVLLTIGFLPQILSTSFGKQLLIQRMEARTHTSVAIGSLQLSWFGPQRLSELSLASPTSKGRVKELQIGVPLWSLSSLFAFKDFDELTSDLKCEGGFFSFQPDDPSGQLIEIGEIEAFLRLHQGAADLTASGHSVEGVGSFSLQGQIKHFSDPSSQFSLHVELASFPTLPLARLLSTRHSLNEQLFLQSIGSIVNLNGSASMQNKKGLIDLSLHTPTIDGVLHGSLTPEALTLRQPITATFQLTPALSQSLLRAMNPLFLTGIRANHPIQLRIEPSSFRLLFGPFSLQNIQIGRGTLDAGQIECTNGSALAALIAILKKDSLKAHEMTVWFTPLSFRLQNGLLETERMDALIADSLHVCTWGPIDLNKDRLKMTFGIPADTLKQVLHLKQVPADYVLKIPVTGSTRNPTLSAGAALAKIAAFLAAEKVPGGAILNLFENQDVPPPQLPFPWER